MHLPSTLVCLLGLAGLLSCAVVKNPTPVESLPPTPPVSEGSGEYQIQVGDELEIKFFYSPELNERVTVRPDGRITLQLIPELTAANLSPDDLTGLLETQYSEVLNEPRIAVMVRSFSGHRIYVDGEVRESGEFDLAGPLTAHQAIAMAGGLKPTARIAEVIVIRRNTDDTPMTIPLNLKDVFNGTDFSQDIQLVPFDVVFVPRSAIANVNKWVDQYVTKNIPFSFGFRVELNR